MVKVISAHHFSCQDIQTCDEPVAATTAPNDLLLLALGNHLVEVRDLNQGANVTFTFPTVDQVASITHCSTGNYVATIEAKTGRQTNGKEPTFARIYTNWDSGTANQPMRARIAGRVTPSSSQSGANALEMIELPLKKPAAALACCQNSGNVVVVCRKTLYLYQLCLKVHEMSKARFLDFEECLMLDVGFPPTQVAVFEDTFGCLSPDIVHVFKVTIQEGESRPKKSEPEKRKEQDAGHIEWNTNIKEVPHLACDIKERLRPKLHPNSFPPLVNLPSIQEHNRKASGSTKSFVETFGPFAKSPVGVKLYGSASLGTQGKVLTAEACSLFHLQNPDGSKDDFQALAFKPALWPKPDEKEAQQRRRKQSNPGFLHSSRYSKLSGMTWLVATRQEGFLYHVPTHVSPEEVPGRVFCMATYPFTASVFRVALESYILHALTETGLETYTLRDAHFSAKDGIEGGECVPATKDPICLIGLRPFFGVEHLLVSESHLVLLACAEGSSSSSQESQEEGEVLPYWDLQEGSWTLYSLCLPTPSTLYQDMVQVAQAHRPNSPSTYSYLLLEAHLIARAGLHHRLWQWTMGEKVQKEDLHKLKEMYRESCALLGDYYVMCEEKPEWRQASSYYRMSGLPMADVMTRVLNLETRSQTQGSSSGNRVLPGLMVYLKSVMMDHRQDPLPTPLANTVVDLFGEQAPGELADIVLGSNSLRDCKVDRILQAIRRHLSSSSPGAKEALALTVLYIQKGSTTQSQSMLNSLTASQLSATLREHHHLLVEVPPSGQVAFSDLASLVKDVRPEVLVDVMASLVEQDRVALSVVLLMFLDSLPLLSGESTAGVDGSRLLRSFLEVYFSRWCASEIREQQQVNPEHNQALQLLVRANLASLCSPPCSGGNETRVELFGKRPNYLDSLPPFLEEEENPGKMQPEEEYHMAVLSKLQSLLCAPFITKDCLNTVLQFLEANPTVCGSLSLRVLCSPPKDATTLLLELHPQVLVDYAKETIQTEEEWKTVLMILQNWINDDENRDTKLVCLRTQRVLLHHLAQNMSPGALAHALPSVESPDFSPYMRQCRQVQQANQMRSLIMNTGQQLLESLNLG